MKKRKLRKGRIAIVVVLLLTILISAVGFIWYYTNLSPVGKSTENREFTVNIGENYKVISKNLKEQKLIRSELAFEIYVKLNSQNNLKAGTYHLNENMSVKEIIEVLTSNNTVNPSITFREGLNMRKIVQIIEENTNNTKEEIEKTISNKEYLKELIEKYWFLTDDILNDKIYYPLEGYLFPDTYEIKGKDTTVQEIIETMLDQTDKQLSKVRNQIQNSKYSIHELLTMASIIELEARENSDRKGVAGVFYNRIEDNWSLGSDVTTYYAIKIDVGERDLYQSELDDYNDYNTRSTKMKGKLPISPICNPSIDSIEAAVNPTKHNYFYFVADKNGKNYFSKTSKEHDETIKKLKAEGLWYTYD